MTMSLPGYEPARMDAIVIGFGMRVAVGVVVFSGIAVGGCVAFGGSDGANCAIVGMV